jgi:N utilization substance protein B
VSGEPRRKPPISAASRARSKGREIALKYLYQADVRPTDAERFDSFVAHQDESGAAVEFARTLVEGVDRDKAALDEIISRLARNWSVKRMPIIDRNILRIGTLELQAEDAPPRSVVINEAIELAKRFSTGESGRFINGILDRVGRETPGETAGKDE